MPTNIAARPALAPSFTSQPAAPADVLICLLFVAAALLLATLTIRFEADRGAAPSPIAAVSWASAEQLMFVP